MGSPFLILLCRLGSAAKLSVFLGDAHRKSGVFSFCFALSPVESCSPPKLSELTRVGVRLWGCERKREDYLLRRKSVNCRDDTDPPEKKVLSVVAQDAVTVRAWGAACCAPTCRAY